MQDTPRIERDREHQPESAGACDVLYIYYLNGRFDPALEPASPHFIGNWEEDGFSFLFFSRQADGQVKDLLAFQPHLDLIDKYTMSYDDWHGGRVEPFEAGGFLVVPPWVQPPGKDLSDKKQMIIDPGVVFGTGTHPTTHDCLEAIASLWYEDKIESVLDLGTGTGILAVAAVLMGSKSAVAVDLNFLAAKTALKNVGLNNLDAEVLVVQGRAEDLVDRSADLLISNIHFDVMRQLIRDAAFLEHGWFILSGLLRSEAREVAGYLERLPVKIVNTWECDGIWHTFLGKIKKGT